MNLKKLNGLQKNFLIKFFLAFLGIILSFILIIYIILFHVETNLYLVFCVSLGLCGYGMKHSYKQFDIKVKKIVIPHLLSEASQGNVKLLWGRTFSKKLFKKAESFNKYDLSNIQDKEFVKSDNDIAVVFNCWDIKIPTDDHFSGIHNNIIFSFFDGNEFKEINFKCVVVKIACDLKYKNKLVVTNPSFIESSWKKDIRSKLRKEEKHIFANENIKIYTNYPTGSDEVLTPNFINLINYWGDKYTFVFGKGNLYIVIPTAKDYFKLGSLFKRVDDIKQYQNFINDIQEILAVVYSTSELEYLLKSNEEILDIINN